MSKVWAEDDFPGLRAWRPLDDEMRRSLLVQPPGEAWSRLLPDDARGGLPAFVVEVCWIDAHGLRRIAVDGFTMDSAAAHSVDERRLLDDLTVLRATVAQATMPLNSDSGSIQLYDGTVYDGLPTNVVNEFMG